MTYLEKAFQAGAQRVELCDNLAVGGHDTFLWCQKAVVEFAKDYKAKGDSDDFVHEEAALSL
ncbi:MAG: copper homeostasis protein CutC [Streptococcus salivarius]